MKRLKLLSLVLAIAIMLSSLPVSSFVSTVYADEMSDTEGSGIVNEDTEILLDQAHVTDTGITIRWNAVPNAETYTVMCNSITLAENISENQYEITDLQPGSEVYAAINAYDAEGMLLASSEESVFYTSLTVNSDMTLTHNLTADSLHVNEGTLDLNGYSVIVDKDVNINSSSAKIRIGSGSLYIKSDLKLQNRASENDYVGGLEMTDSKGKVYVGGNFALISRNFGELSAGTLELGGNISSNQSQYSGLLYATDNHRIIFSGQNTQTIDLSSYAKLNIVEIKNFSEGGVVFTNRISVNALKDNGCKVLFASEENIIGWALNEDEIYDGTLLLAAGTLNLNGHKLTITGDLLQSGGTVFVNGGELDIQGDYKLQYMELVNNGILNMTNDADIVRISGDFAMQSGQSHDGKLSAGIMEIGGDLIQKSNNNFQTSGNHTVLLNGSTKQTINIYNSSINSSRINNLIIENTSDDGVEFTNTTYIVGDLHNTETPVSKSANIRISSSTRFPEGVWNYDITANDNTVITEVEIGGNLYINGNGVSLDGNVGVKQSLYINKNIDLCGNTLDVGGDVWISARLNVNKGTLNVGGDLNISDLNKSYSNGYLTMKYNEDYICIGGNMLVFSNNYYYPNELTNGIIEIKGDFIQKYSSREDNFFPSGKHQVILSGDSLQKIKFNSNMSRFNVLEIKNSSEDGVEFLSEVKTVKLVTNDCNVRYYDLDKNNRTLSDDEVIDGDLLFESGTLDLNGHTLTVIGNLFQTGGTLNINGGTLEIQGDYLIRKINEKISYPGEGKLLMTKESDTVKVAGDFVMQSNVSHKNCLTNGVIEVGGNLSQGSGATDNFFTSGNHTVILNGSKPQTIEFYNGSGSVIKNLKIENPSVNGVTFKNAVYISGMLYNTESVVNKSENIYTMSETVFEDNMWNNSITFIQSRQLPDNLKIKGDVYIRAEISLPDNSKYAVSKDGFSKENSDGYTLSVDGDVYVLGDILHINSGSVFVGKNLYLGNSSMSSGSITMKNASDFVFVSGSVFHYSNGFYLYELSDGTMELKGDFIQTGSFTDINSDLINFKLLLSGDKLQTIKTESPNFSFGVIDVKNYSEDGVFFASLINADELQRNGCNVKITGEDSPGWTLSEDEIYDGDLTISRGILDLNGHKLTVNGSLAQSGGIVLINGGELIVNGDYCIQNKFDNKIENSSGELKMTNESDTVQVSGSFVMQSSKSHRDNLTAGTLMIGGDLLVLENGVYDNFYCTESHTVVLNGSGAQRVRIDCVDTHHNNNYYYYDCYASDYSRINNLKIKNTSNDGVSFDGFIYVVGTLYNSTSNISGSRNIGAINTTVFENNTWNGDISFFTMQNLKYPLYINGNVYMYGSVSVNSRDVYGKDVLDIEDIDSGDYFFIIDGNLYLYNSIYLLNQSSMIVSGNINIEKNKNGYYGGFISLYSDSKMFIGGNLKSSSENSCSFEGGILEIRGDMIFSDEKSEFTARRGHTTIFSGNRLQTISAAASKTCFDIIDIRNHSDDGVCFKTFIPYSELIDNGCKITYEKEAVIGWTLTDDEILDGDVNLASGTLDLNGHRLTINGDLIQSGGTVLVNGGELCIAGDYKIQRETDNKYSDSTGILMMTNEADKVKVEGSFIMQSTYSHIDYLSAGTLEIGGDLLQIGNPNNFHTSGLHNVVLNGTSGQRVNFGSSYSANSNITNLRICNTSVPGVEFETRTYVTGKLYDTSSRIINGKNLHVIDTTDFIDNAWSADIYFEKTPTLRPNFYLDGSLYLYSQLVLTGDMSINGSVYASADINMNGYNFDVEKDLWLNSLLYVNGGKLYIGNDLNICSTSFGTSNGYLYMDNTNDYALVNGRMFIYSAKNTYLYRGMLEVKGDFTQKNYRTVNNLSSAGTVIFSGSEIQRISVENALFKFNTLEITKPLKTGYIFSRTPMWNTLSEKFTDTEAPSAPYKLSLLNSTSTSIRMKWTGSKDNSSECIYDIYRDGRLAASVQDTEYIDNGLVSHTEYSYYVTARDTSGNVSEPSNTLLASTDSNISALLQPTDLEFKVKYDGSICLSWKPPANSDDTVIYSIYRNGAIVGTSKSAVYIDKNIEQGYYEYYVEAANENSSAVSNSVFVDTMPPETPVISATEISDNKAVLSWTCSDNVSVDHYNLYKNGTLYRALTKNYYTDTSFSSNVETSYYVIAYDDAGNASQASNTVSFVSAKDQAPPEVTGLSYDNGKLSDAKNTIRVSCTDDTALSEFIAEIKPVNSEEWKTVYSQIVSKTYDTVEFSVSNFVSGSGDYNIRITLKDYAANVTVYEDVFGYVKNELIRPIVTSSSAGNTAYIEWTPASETFDVKYYLYRRCNNGKYQCIIITDDLSFTDSTLNERYTYTYYVLAKDKYDNEIGSNSVTIKPSTDETKPEILHISCDGQTLSEGKNDVIVYCSDNICLANMTAEIKAADGGNWIRAAYMDLSKPVESVTFPLGSNISASGEYCMRVTVSDIAGNKTVSEAVFSYAANTMTKPEITAIADGCNVVLNWTAAENNEKIEYSVFRIDTSGNKKCIANTENTDYKDIGLIPLTKYEYSVVAYDENENTVKSEVCNVITGKDNIKPTANMSANSAAVAGHAVKFDASASNDNYDIKSYKWDFGDGTSGVGKNTAHIYSDIGSYTVTLTVTDESGNSDVDTAAVEVHGNDYGVVEIMVTDSSGNALPTAFAYCEELIGTESTMLSADDNGLISLAAKEGTYSFYFYAGMDYIPQKQDIDIKNIVGENSKVTIILEKADIVTADFDFRELGIKEIQDLGIDITAPENQFLCKVEMKVDNAGTGDKEVFEVIVNQNGELINIEANKGFTVRKNIDRVEKNTTPLGTSTTSTSTSTLQSGIIKANKPTPISLKTIVSMSVTEYSWLKDFYEVSITFSNNSDEGFDIINPRATLILPDGLSLASTAASNSISRTMNTIEGGTSETVTWIVKGDIKGSYNISVDFEGTLSPFEIPIEASFTGNKTLNVVGGNALKLTLNAFLKKADLKLTNVSKDSLYNVKVSMDSYGEFKDAQKILLQYPCGLVEKIEWTDNTQTEIKSTVYFPVNMDPNTNIDALRTLKPGESIIGKLWYRQNEIDSIY